MLSLTSPILEDDIFGIACLAPRHPVYLLDGLRGDQLVIKQENLATRAGLSNVALVMNAVDPSAPSTALSPGEISQLRLWLSSHRPTCPASAQLHAELSKFLNADGWWSKMPAKANIVDLGHAVKSKNAGDKSELRTIAAVLNTKSGLEKLGNILAADLFNGNTDRFCVNFRKVDEDVGNNRGDGKLFHHFVNLGNLLLTKNGKKQGELVGLDAYDPSSAFRDWQEPLAKSEYSSMIPWMGRMLARPEGAKRTSFVDRCLDDINFAMGPRNRRIPFASKVRIPNKNGEACVAIRQGIEDGTEKIRVAVSKFFRGKPKPAGIVDRAQILGWILP